MGIWIFVTTIVAVCAVLFLGRPLPVRDDSDQEDDPSS